MAHIDKCIRDLLHKSGKKAAHDHAAPWVPDTEASICMVCNKSQFTLINRRVSELNYYLLSNLIINFIFLINFFFVEIYTLFSIIVVNVELWYVILVPLENFLCHLNQKIH